MALNEYVKITPRFQRAIRIDNDLDSKSAINGFVCPKSSADVLLAMVRHISETQQCAFTWTGPYGSGKSSLAIVLGSLLSGNVEHRRIAKKAIGEEISEKIFEGLPCKRRGWRILPVVGSRENPAAVIGKAIQNSGLISCEQNKWTEQSIINILLKTANKSPKSYGGLLVFIDEMGKFLEGAAHDGSDIYLFQQLAEAASRSNKRLIIVGILHQAFGDYAHQISREMRDEWSKIQGRFIDLPINVAGEEQIDLLSKAIVSFEQPTTKRISEQVAWLIRKNKRGVSPLISSILAECWPLHPVVASLLGPISRRRFGQNQRSLFGFLNSAEPFAFQSFLSYAKDSDLYTLDILWEYLRLNLEPSILASPDGHRWAHAVEAVERCESQIANDLHSKLLKSIALIDLFKGNSGLVASTELLYICFPDVPQKEISNILQDLKSRALIIFKKHSNSFSIYAGSDFDIDDAVNKARQDILSINFQGLKRLAGLQPILAKRHYHKTGTLRWFDVELVPINKVIETVTTYCPSNGTVGLFLLAISTEYEDSKLASEICVKAAKLHADKYIVIGLSKQSWTINEFALEILATEKVYNENNSLGGDSVARLEVRTRLSDLQSRLEAELNRAFDHASWFHDDGVDQELTRRELSVLASDLADKCYPESPRIHSELLNRIKPSSNAVAAQNALLRCMVMNEGEHRLGIKGFPAEGGLFTTIIEASNLYDNSRGAFVAPLKNQFDACNIAPLWQAATSLLKFHMHRSVSIAEIYDVWRMPPYGVRDGLMPILAVAYILSERKHLAFYRDGIFQSRLNDVDIEILAKDASAIRIRYMNLSEMSKKLLSGLAETVRLLDKDNNLEHLEPIDVARGLIAIYDNVHPWAKRTLRLSKNTIRIRNLFKKANDPNKFLFDDIPALLDNAPDLNDPLTVKKAVALVHNGLSELVHAYDVELERLQTIMLSELQVPNTSVQALAELRDRALNIKDVSGVNRLEQFIVRLMEYKGIRNMESLASLATDNKPTKMWIDNDLIKAKVEITHLAQEFKRAETVARVKGRKDKRHSLAIIIAENVNSEPLQHDFDILEAEKHNINNLVREIEKAMSDVSDKNVILAALAQVSANIIKKDNNSSLVNSKAVIND